MIVHRYEGRFANQAIQYLLIKYYSIKHKNPVNFIQGNHLTHPHVIEYNNVKRILSEIQKCLFKLNL